MTEIFENLDQNVNPAKLRELENAQHGYEDPEGVFPKPEYLQGSGVNDKARGSKRTNVYLGGSVSGLDLELESEPVSVYPNNQVKETASGHIIEYDDTPNAQRVMIRHRTGSGVEMRADGTVIYSSTKNTVRVTAEDEKVIVDGDGELHYNGNLKLKVAGDFDIEVGGDFNIKTDGDLEQTVKRGFIQEIAGNQEIEIVGSKTEQIAGTKSEVILGDRFETIKGNVTQIVGSNVTQTYGDTLILTAENEITLSTRSANIASSSLLVAGDSGTIGGEEMVVYGKTAHIPRINSTEMTSTTFRGDLVGTATQAIDANQSAKALVATSLGAGAGTGGHSATDTTATNKNTVQVTNAVAQAILNNSPKGIRRVDVDDGNFLKDKIDQTTNYGGVSKTLLTTREARSKLRDANNLNNEEFIGAILSEGIISPGFANIAPGKTGRIIGSEKSPMRPDQPVGRAATTSKLFT
ncbi:MAG: hypothetical protein CL669_06295 [Balneola sp.]|nr:hypothetical protein [Balneola sp.]|tara:strand:+ start:273 stop:1667 length:1395 start_codon:yes stop_codon:yes gene_type:complete